MVFFQNGITVSQTLGSLREALTINLSTGLKENIVVFKPSEVFACLPFSVDANIDCLVCPSPPQTLESYSSVHSAVSLESSVLRPPSDSVHVAHHYFTNVKTL